jgi:hypothetical protein
VSLSDELCRSYQDLRWHFDPAAATLAGVADRDGQLGRYDAASVREHLAAFRALEAGIEELAVQDAADEIDRTALLDDVRVTIFRLQHEQPHVRNPAFWLLHLAEALHGLLPAAGRPACPPAAALTRLQAIPEFLDSGAATLRRPVRDFVDIAVALTGPVADLVRRVDRECRGWGGEDHEAWTLAGSAAEAAIVAFRSALDGELAEQADPAGCGTGDDHFERLLHFQHAITGGAPELWRFLLRMEEETEEELRQLSDVVYGSTDWRALLQHRIGTSDPIRDIGKVAVLELGRITEFVQQHDLVAVDLDGLEVAPLPAWLGVVTCDGAYYPAPVKDSGPAHLLFSNSPLTSATLSPLLAELGIPGLHLQMRHAARQASEIRRHLSSGLLREAWGLYALEMLDQAGYWPDPADRLMVRAHVLLRVLLARVDIGLHTRQMTVREGVDTLAGRMPITSSHALAAVRGIALEPTAATGAVIGRRELGRLRQARETGEHPFFSLRPFHDEVLSYGGLPIPLIRWGMGAE